MIADAINDHIDSLSRPPTSPIEATIEELIESGESADLEFKQTFRWDIDKGQPNKKMEEVIAKCVASFANSDGGTLLIGVHDTEGAVGLESDFSARGGDRDGFELALTNSLQNQFGTAFKAQRVKISFPTANGVQICKIDVTRSPTLLPVEITTKDGQKSKRIYVRSGNSSQELPGHEVQAYIAARATE
ncbi:helix-turn-helix domain-containing protein [Bradyrhizobium sp. RDM4]|uniref:AlbA family DNA-binding domain-containing protein n=1 Tax=Bradyrhizobium sp. RDM4 TaxID=3378765 RepID=UPI0038FC7483